MTLTGNTSWSLVPSQSGNSSPMFLTPLQQYVKVCRSLNVRCNRMLCQQLGGVCLTCVQYGDDGERDEHLRAAKTALDFSTNLLGRHGLRPVLELCRSIPIFEALNFRQNFLDSSSVVELTELLNGVNHVRCIDLGNNPRIGHAGGKALLSFVTTNKNIVELHLDGTSINASLVQTIGKFVIENSKAVVAPTAVSVDRPHRYQTPPRETHSSASGNASTSSCIPICDSTPSQSSKRRNQSSLSPMSAVRSSGDDAKVAMFFVFAASDGASSPRTIADRATPLEWRQVFPSLGLLHDVMYESVLA